MTQDTLQEVVTEDDSRQLVSIPDSQITPLSMLQVAVQRGASIEQLQALMDLQERHERNEARKAFVAALNEFKANPPSILKSNKVAFGNTKYAHATLDNASELIGEALAKVGISHRWNVEQEGAKIKVSCILTHAMGHSESVSMEASADTSGSKNSIQAVGSAVSYLQRYTLFAASGIAPKAVDDDGRGGAGVHEMDERVKADFIEQIAGLTHKKEVDALWQKIAAECTKSGDIPTYTELKAALSAKSKSLSAVTTATTAGVI